MVGINTYVRPTAGNIPTGRRFSNLTGAVNDAREFAALLQSNQFDRENIKLLLERDATARNILDRFGRHLIDASTCRGDISVFYYSGHGSEIRNVARPANSVDAFDQTLVPYDAPDGAPDIRDKELVRLYAAAARKGITLTVIADSCHSGGLSRGAATFARPKDLAPDGRVVNDPGIREDPTRKSSEYATPVMVLAAAFEKEVAWEDDTGDEPRGAFSAALFEALKNHPPHDSIGAIFSDIQAAVAGRFVDQHPQLIGEGRARLDLFGQPADPTPGVVARYLRISPSGALVMDHGTASGVYPRCEFQRSAGARSDLRIRVTEARLADSDAEVVTGDPGLLRPGDRFEMVRWAAPDQNALSFYYALDGPPLEELVRVAGALRNLESAGVRIVADPAGETPNFQVWWIGGEWKLLPGRSLGTKLDPDALRRWVARGDSLFVNFPLPVQCAPRVGLEPRAASAAEYTLVGRWTGEEFAYAWVRPGATDSDQPKLNMPVRTDWIGSTTPGFESALASKAQQLNRIKRWLTLEPPGGGVRNAFPYHVSLRKVGAAPGGEAGGTEAGEQYKIWLAAAESDLTAALKSGGVEQRWVYVLSLDRDGTVRRIIPAADGNVGNLAPPAGEHPNEIALTDDPADLSIAPPYGLDTLILLTSATPIDPRVLPAEGVRTRSEFRGGDPLSALLGNFGASGRRGEPPEVPLTWSIERHTFRSARK